MQNPFWRLFNGFTPTRNSTPRRTSMRRIAIVGAGQAGLQLGLGLLAQGYHVSLTTNRTGEQVRAGKVMSSQCMFNTSLQTERDLGLNFWEDQCPAVEGIGLAVPDPVHPDRPAFQWERPPGALCPGGGPASEDAGLDGRIRAPRG
ncbi:hypothetical protein Q3H58_000170 [Pseudomonas psychrotolerans]|nr:hypothetical protein [Pseudomonas psychrotolerans]